MKHQAHKTPEYLKAYDTHFKGRDVERLLEIGVQFGGSLDIWRDYFPKAEIVGLDNDPRCKNYVKDYPLFIGNQSDTALLETLGKFDIIIDDGSHKMSDQQTTFEFMFPRLKRGGMYVIEDLHTSYWPEFLDQRLTTIEYLKNKVDELHAEASQNSRAEGGTVYRNEMEIKSLHFYPDIIFIEK